MDNYQIIITRANAFYGCALKHTVEIDGLSVGVLKNGETLPVYTTAGRHTLSFISHGKIEKSISLLIEPEQHVTRLFAKLNGRQKLEITKQSNTIQPDINSELDKSVPKKKKHPILKVFGIIFIAFIAIGIIGSLGDDTSSNTPSENMQSETLTDEEKAAEELEKATEAFYDQDYMSAIRICNNISAQYPDTEVTANMNTYLEEQYTQFPHFSATDLMSEYDGNIVNADKQYNDTVMIVSGTVTDIGKTNGDSNLTVMLDSGTLFYGVQLNFKTSQTDAVAILSKGDLVAVIGRCTGKSGKQFIILDGNNVMIENCYLIG